MGLVTSLFTDVSEAVRALSRLGKSQLLLVFIGAIVSVVLSGICTAWGGSAFFATLAFLICDVVNAIYSITYENSFAFTSLGFLLVEQNVVLTASSAIGILSDNIPGWAPHALPWIAVACGWVVLVVLLGLQLVLRKDWGWHAHKLGLARTEDVNLYQRILQLEGAILLDFCQLAPCTVVVLGRYGFTGTDSLATPAPSSLTTTAAPTGLVFSSSTTASPAHRTGDRDHDTTDTDGLSQVVSVLFFASALLGVVCAPILAATARKELAGLFTVAAAATILSTAAIAFGTADALNKVWPARNSDIVLVALVIATCVARVVLVAAIARVHHVFGSGIAARISRGDGGALLAASIEGWSECRRSGFGGGAASSQGGVADLEGANLLVAGGSHHNIDDYSDTESDLGNGSSPNLMDYGERVRVRISPQEAADYGTAGGGGGAGNDASDRLYGHLNRSVGPNDGTGGRPSFVSSQNDSLLSGTANQTYGSIGGNSAQQQQQPGHRWTESGNSMTSLNRTSNMEDQAGATMLSDAGSSVARDGQRSPRHTISFVKANIGKRPTTPNSGGGK